MFFNLPRQFWASLVFFFAFGMAFGVWGGHVASIENQIGDSEEVFGRALFGAAIGFVLSALFVGKLVERWGTANVLRWGWVVYLGAIGFVFWIDSAFLLFFVMLLIGLMGGGIDIAVNAQTGVTERNHNLNLLSRAHAVWSLGGFVGAGSAALFLSFEARTAHIITALVVLAVITFWASLNLYTKDEEQSEALGQDDERDDQAHTDTTSTNAAANSKGKFVSKSPWTSPVLLLMGALAFGGLFVESGMMDWSPIYFTDFRNSDPATGAWIFASFSGAMFVVRMLGDLLRQFVRDKHLLIWGGLLSGAGLLAGFRLPSDAAAVAVMSFAGIGIALIYPLIMSRAAAFRFAGQTNLSSAGNIAVPIAMGSAAMLVGPPAIGWIAENLSWAWSMVLIASFGPAIALMAALLPRQSAKRDA